MNIPFSKHRWEKYAHLVTLFIFSFSPSVCVLDPLLKALSYTAQKMKSAKELRM